MQFWREQADRVGVTLVDYQRIYFGNSCGMALPAAEVKARSRGALNTNPTGRFTMDRAALAEFENNGLKKHFAEWITKMTHVPVSEKTFCEDLKDGTALCSIMARIEGSGIPKFHNVKQSPKHLREFQRRDNLVGVSLFVLTLD